MNQERRFFSRAPEGQEKPVHKAEETTEVYLQGNIEHMVEGTLGILDVFRSEIDERKWDSIVVDDTRARLHGLLMRKVINDQYHGEKRINAFFVKASRRRPDLLAQYLEKMKPRLGNQVLVVTEEICSEGKVRLLKAALEVAGIGCDIATFSVANPFDKDDIVEKRGDGVLVTDESGFSYGVGGGLGVLQGHYAQDVLGVDSPNSDTSVVPVKRESVETPYSVQVDPRRFSLAGRAFVKKVAEEVEKNIEIRKGV